MNICSLCNTRTLSYAYTPLGSRMEAKVYICDVCGLVQTLPRLDDQSWDPSLSHLADFGGVRTGKGFRASLEMFQGFTPTSIFDVGANRGAFYDAAQAQWAKAKIIAVEPDKNICRKNWLNRRIEEVSFEYDSFDLIYCCHTLEHLPDPKRELARLASWLIPTTGWLYLEVPYLYGSYKRRVEEFFIDRHLTHFSENSLSKLVKAAGLRILKRFKSEEALGFVCAKSIPVASPWDNEAALARGWIENYYRLDFDWLEQKVKELNAGPPLAALGAGRILDAFLAYGLDNLIGVYDDALVGYFVGDWVVQANNKVPFNAPKVAFSRHIEEGMRFDA